MLEKPRRGEPSARPGLYDLGKWTCLQFWPVPFGKTGGRQRFGIRQSNQAIHSTCQPPETPNANCNMKGPNISTILDPQYYMIFAGAGNFAIRRAGGGGKFGGGLGNLAEEMDTLTSQAHTGNLWEAGPDRTTRNTAWHSRSPPPWVCVRPFCRAVATLFQRRTSKRFRCR